MNNQYSISVLSRN